MPINHGYTAENGKSKKTLKSPKIDSRILINFFDKNVALGKKPRKPVRSKPYTSGSRSYIEKIKISFFSLIFGLTHVFLNFQIFLDKF
jgi:hypothetical protein